MSKSKQRNIFIVLDGIAYNIAHPIALSLDQEISFDMTPRTDLKSSDWNKIKKKHEFFFKELPILPETDLIIRFVQQFDERFNIRFLTFVPSEFSNAIEGRLESLKPRYPDITPEFLSYRDFKDRHKLYNPGDIVIDSDINIINKIKVKDIYSIFYQFTPDLEDRNNVIRQLGPYIENEVRCGRA